MEQKDVHNWYMECAYSEMDRYDWRYFVGKMWANPVPTLEGWRRRLEEEKDIVLPPPSCDIIRDFRILLTSLINKDCE